MSEYWNDRRRAENPAVGAIGGARVHPLCVILFGSAVKPATQAINDLDLLVVMPEGTHRRKAAQQLYLHLKGIGIPFDLLVVTLNLLEKHKNNIGLIYKTVLEEGRELSAI